MPKKSNIETKQLTISWLMQAEKVVKFKETDNTFDISDKVAELDFEKFGVGEGSVVNVKIDKDAPECGMVVYMSKVKNNNDSKTEDTKKEASSSSNNKILTIKAFSLKTKAFLFEELEGVWYKFGKNINPDNFDKFGIKKGAKVEVGIAEGEKQKTVIFIKQIQETKTKTDYDKQSPRASSENSRQTSIEAQGAVERAFTLAAKAFKDQKVETFLNGQADVSKFIKTYANLAFDTVQELKQK